MFSGLTDEEQLTGAHGYLAMNSLLAGQREAAPAHLHWLKDKGTHRAYEYHWAMNAMRRLGIGAM